MLSIIIPTLNEEEYLPLLLKSIKKQDFSDYEIIVSDAASQDKTREIAESFGCKIVDGGLPAKGRNQGAKVARGNLLLFLDAETLIPEGFLGKALHEFKKRNLDVAGCNLEPVKEAWMSKFVSLRFGYNLFYNWPAQALESVYPYAASFILIKKDIHERLGGFDETIKISEDHSYVRRAAKVGKFGILRFSPLPLFLRRIEKQGLIRTVAKYFFCNIFNVFLGDVRTDIFHYTFGQYKKKEKPKKTIFILQFFWILICYAGGFLGILKWIVVFIIFTPKLILKKYI
ncbi:glycosyltransferase [Patescibacteria group bacterium]